MTRRGSTTTFPLGQLLVEAVLILSLLVLISWSHLGGFVSACSHDHHDDNMHAASSGSSISNKSSHDEEEDPFHHHHHHHLHGHGQSEQVRDLSYPLVRIIDE
jgi:hypothetical protein